MRTVLVLVSLMFAAIGGAQSPAVPWTKNLLVKTNVLNLLARKPALMVEKALAEKLSVEAGYVQGEFRNFLLTDLYRYNGFIVRGKQYFAPLNRGEVCPFVGVYVGNLVRELYTAGRVNNSGWLGVPSRDMKSNSVRFGGSIGFTFVSKKRLVVEALGSLGKGIYTGRYRYDSRNSGGYLDVQTWASLGYCF